jgi:hypothetical protein
MSSRYVAPHDQLGKEGSSYHTGDQQSLEPRAHSE